MNKRILALTSTVVTVAATLSLTAPVYAWHPKGAIIKKVQNETAKSVLADANTTADAVAAKPGDVLRYVIEVRNDGTPTNNNWNDMAKTVMTDALPVGVELVDNPAQRTISVDMGTLKPGAKVTKEYRVKVVAKTDGAITNKACFTGDSAANDNPQKGCDPAVIKVTVPPVVPPKQPEPPVTPPKTPEQPKPPVVQAVQPAATVLPATGPAHIAAVVAAFTLGGYLAHTVFTRARKQS